MLNSKRSFDNRKWKTGWIWTETGMLRGEHRILCLLKMLQYEKKVVYLQRQNDKNKLSYNQYVQLCSKQKKTKDIT